MTEYISKQAAVDAGYLSDWYISSVGNEPPVWTDAHIDELLNDFIVIPKDTPAADVQPIVYAHKTINVGRRSYCSNCGKLAIMENFCSKCGAKVEDGDVG